MYKHLPIFIVLVLARPTYSPNKGEQHNGWKEKKVDQDMVNNNKKTQHLALLRETWFYALRYGTQSWQDYGLCYLLPDPKLCLADLLSILSSICTITAGSIIKNEIMLDMIGPVSKCEIPSIQRVPASFSNNSIADHGNCYKWPITGYVTSSGVRTLPTRRWF